ncbi:hypothetical protein KVR01_001134 [Diaporthe batatas]|uniref:uncharacterized protein n=1 Tax=Diaporthe batatas TaxID=748121 RepID=UPI001D04E4BF|nr:uncharacterized protein KVR01_001134 [Diaporthe batatas]KAG8168385.1 hypothetical protein KVR01_001134 [Diaporthe batatas]
MYNISRAFRTAEAQKLLPILGQRFDEVRVKEAASQPAHYLSPENLQGIQRSLLYNFEPPSHEAAVTMDRKIGVMVQALQRRQNPMRAAPFDQGDELGRVQWSAINIIVSIAETGTTPFNDRRRRQLVRSQRLIDPEFWDSYHNMIQYFSQLERSDYQPRRDLNSISNAIANRMEDLRQTFHDLNVEERDAFHTLMQDLLPVTKHVTTEELDQNLANPPARCIVCNLPFSTAVREPMTPALGSFPATRAREQQVHYPVSYDNCASVPQKHAFCLRELGRALMDKDPQTRKVLRNKPKTDLNWRCRTCYVDPWKKQSA